jgi:hypothetical protein
MTDNDDSAPSRDRPSRSGNDVEERHDDARSEGVRAVITVSGGKIAQAAPTDPEVPSAKRRGALRQKRFLVGLAAIVLGLLSITFAVLYRAGQRVGIPNRSGPPTASAANALADDVPPRLDATDAAPRTSPPSTPSQLDLPPHSTDEASSARTSPGVHSPAAASGIIRTPSF